MRTQHPLLLPLGCISIVAAHLIKPTLNIRMPETTTAPTFPTSPAQILQQCAECQLVAQALAICLSLSPSFTTLQPTAQAKCLCYSSTVWSPNFFDYAVQSCADFASTAAPTAFGALSNLEYFCGNMGDVEKPATVFTLAPIVGGGGDTGTGGMESTASISNYVPPAPVFGGGSSSPAMTANGGAGSTTSAAAGSSNTGTTEPKSPMTSTLVGSSNAGSREVMSPTNSAVPESSNTSTTEVTSPTNSFAVGSSNTSIKKVASPTNSSAVASSNTSTTEVMSPTNSAVAGPINTGAAVSTSSIAPTDNGAQGQSSAPFGTTVAENGMTITMSGGQSQSSTQPGTTVAEHGMNSDQGSTSSSMTSADSGMTITANGVAATNTGDGGSVARIVLPQQEVVWLSFGTALLILFL